MIIRIIHNLSKMKVSERSKSSTRSMTPKRIISQKPPFPKLIQKKPRLSKLTLREANKENIGLEMILPKDALLIKPNESINQSLYTQSPLGENHICFPYELPGKTGNLNISAKSSWGNLKETSQSMISTPSVARNNRVKLLSKNFKIDRYALTGRCKGFSQNSTPEPREN